MNKFQGTLHQISVGDQVKTLRVIDYNIGAKLTQRNGLIMNELVCHHLHDGAEIYHAMLLEVAEVPAGILSVKDDCYSMRPYYSFGWTQSVMSIDIGDQFKQLFELGFSGYLGLHNTWWNTMIVFIACRDDQDVMLAQLTINDLHAFNPRWVDWNNRHDLPDRLQQDE